MQDVRIEIVRGRIWLKSAYDPGVVAAAKRINGYSWAPGNKVWTFPLDYSTCLQLRKEFGHALQIGPHLKEWAKAEKKRYEELLALASEVRADLGAVAQVSPVLAEAMGARPYQQVGSAWIARARQALLGDDPGLGKTLQAMGAVVEAGVTGPIIVFAPKTAAMITWVDEVQKWLPDDMLWCVTALNSKGRNEALAQIKRFYEARAGFPDDQKTPEPRLWVLCNIEMARVQVEKEINADGYERLKEYVPKYPDMFQIPWAAAIVDESHNGLITKFSQPWKMSQQRAGMALLPMRDGAMKLAMSGTPMRGKMYNLWGTLNWLRPDRYPSFWNWTKKYFQVYDDGYGLLIEDELKEELEQDFYRDINTMMLRRTKGEVAADLPPKMYAGKRLEGQNSAEAPGHWLPMHPQQAKAYAKLAKDATIELEGGTLMANGTLAITTRLKQFAGATWKIIPGQDAPYPCRPSNKLDWVEEFLQERGILGDDEYGDGKVIIASQSTKLVNFFAEELEALGVKCHVLTGETKPERRKEMVHEFQNLGGPRVFLLNTKAGGVSLTLDAADDVVILDELWDPDAQTQVEDRAHRVSREHQVTIHYVRSLGTIEEEIALDVGSKEDRQRRLLDGRRGVEYAKKLVETIR